MAKAVCKKKKKTKLEISNSLISNSIMKEALVIEAAWYWHQNRQVDGWNQMETQKSPRRSLGTKNTQRGEDSFFSKWCWGDGALSTIHRRQLRMD